MLVANAALLRIGLAPLDRLTRAMTTVDLLRPGQRLPVRGRGEIAELISTFNTMLDRLEAERAASSARALSAQEAERRRIAQELHDEVGPEPHRRAARAQARGRPGARAAARGAAPGPGDHPRAAWTRSAGIARRLRPGVLEDLGLVSALTSLTTEFSTHTGLRRACAASTRTCPTWTRRPSWCSTGSPRRA